MSTARSNEDGGYGNSSLVGSDSAGLKSALESRESVAAPRGNEDRARGSREEQGNLGQIAASREAGSRVDGPDSSAGLGTSIDDSVPESPRETSGGHGGRDGLED